MCYLCILGNILIFFFSLLFLPNLAGFFLPLIKFRMDTRPDNYIRVADAHAALLLFFVNFEKSDITTITI